jgi:opacity protein-like surface antigen
MGRTFASALLVSFAALAPIAAHANDGLYLELQGGGTFWQDADISVTSLGVGEAEFETGWNAGLAIGFRIFELLRFEAHGSYRQADLDRIDVGPFSVSGEGFTGAAAILGNVYLDIPLPLPIKPYVGGGAGAAIFWADVDGNSVDVDDDDTEFAWNVMGGVFVPILRHLELDVRYRYLTSDDPEVDADLLGLGEGTAKAEFEVHEVVGALRVVF